MLRGHDGGDQGAGTEWCQRFRKSARLQRLGRVERCDFELANHKPLTKRSMQKDAIYVLWIPKETSHLLLIFSLKRILQACKFPAADGTRLHRCHQMIPINAYMCLVLRIEHRAALVRNPLKYRQGRITMAHCRLSEIFDTVVCRACYALTHPHTQSAVGTNSYQNAAPNEPSPPRSGSESSDPCMSIAEWPSVKRMS